MNIRYIQVFQKSAGTGKQLLPCKSAGLMRDAYFTNNPFIIFSQDFFRSGRTGAFPEA